jgi:hypothetical protein
VPSHSRVELRGSAFGLLAAVQRFGNPAASTSAGLLWMGQSRATSGPIGSLGKGEPAVAAGSYRSQVLVVVEAVEQWRPGRDRRL